jgi:pyruvate kinase
MLELIDKGSAHRKQRKTITGDFIAAPQEIRVFKGDAILLSRDQAPGEAAQLDAGADGGRTVAHIGCTEPAVFDGLKPGQPVWIDDGRVGAMVETIDDRGALLRVNHARASGEKIGSDKGLNFPQTELALPTLTDKDLLDLDFAASHADIIGQSFVRCASDVDRLSRAMEKRGAKRLGIVAKIETQQGVRNLPEIIIHGAGRHRFAIMIARGDLAVEIGYERLAEIQEEVLWVCEAGRVPVIWATQVLEELVKTDKPSRAEMTDAAMSQRAECVMLNKGPYVLHALAALDSVVERMQAHQHKKTAQFRALHW